MMRLTTRLLVLGAALWAAPLASQTRGETLHLRDAVARLVQIRSVVNNSQGAKDMATRAIAAESLYFRSKAPVTPPPVNKAPVAALGLSCVPTTRMCTANATASTDDKAVTGYTIVWGDGTPAATAAIASHPYAQPGNYTIGLTVRDAEGLTGTAVAIASIAAQPPPDSVIVADSTTSIAAPAELPRSVPNPVFAKATRTTLVTVPMDLQGILNASQLGDSILLAAGTVWTGNFVLPTRSCGAGITIATAVALPAGRMTPSKAASLRLAKLVSPNSVAALATTNPTCGWRLVGLEIVYAGPGTTENYGALWLGDGGAPWETQKDSTKIPNDFLLDRLYIHGAPTLPLRRCLYINSGRTIVRDSWLSDCHSNGGDSQALLGCNGPGPYLIENNYLEGAHENILFGGCDPAIPGLTPSDITIRRNHVAKPLGWRTATPKWTTKNLFELKNAQRVLVEDNVFENVWPDGQEGMAIVIKTATDKCQTCDFEGTTDLTFRYNIVRNAAVGLNLQAIDRSPGQIDTKRHVARVVVTDNLFDQIGAEGRAAAMMFTHDLADITVHRNTFKHHASVGSSRGSGLTGDYADGAARRLDFRNNVIPMGAYWFFYTNGYIGSDAMRQMVNDGSWRVLENALVSDGSLASKFPPSNTYPASYPLTSGVDMAELNRRTAGVVIAP